MESMSARTSERYPSYSWQTAVPCCGLRATGAEDQVNTNQQMERSKMEKDYQAQMATLSEELNRVRQELTSRTEVMGHEMERWRQTAEATSRFGP